jgi:hypothetical protein
MHPVNSFDVFDTLVARRCVTPRRLLEVLERQSGLPGLAAARLAADAALGAAGKPYDLRAIWREVSRATGISPDAAERLEKQELQLEHEQVIPVAENLALVRDGDLLVSDTYLPAEQVLSLLRRAGLKRVVTLVASNDGKFTGRVWPELLARMAIHEHLGDNPHSDGKMPSEAGIRAVIYTGSGLSAAERFLAERGREALALLAREVRLANPFPPSQGSRRHLWNLSCQLNFPLLYLASLWLERSARCAGASELFFVSRDCLMWRALFERLFPHRRSTYLYASRLCLLKPSEGYLDYFRSAWHPGGLVVDLSSTGASWASFFARLNQKGRCRFVAWIDDYAYLHGGPRPEDWLEVEAVCRTGSPGPVMNKGVEMLNYAPHGSVEDVLLLPGGAALPVLSDELEYDPALPQAAHDAFAACVEALGSHPDLLAPQPEAPGELVRALAGLVCADPRLPGVYPGHQAADLAYHHRILA